jgi:hypothetical protein
MLLAAFDCLQVTMHATFGIPVTAAMARMLCCVLAKHQTFGTVPLYWSFE